MPELSGATASKNKFQATWLADCTRNKTQLLRALFVLCLHVVVQVAHPQELRHIILCLRRLFAFCCACRDLCDSNLVPAHTRGSEYWLSPPSRLLQPSRSQEIGLSTSVLGGARTAICHCRQDRQSHMTDHGCFPIRSHDLSLVLTSRELLAEDCDVSFTVAPAWSFAVLTPSDGSPSSSSATATSPAFSADRLHKYPYKPLPRFVSHRSIRLVCSSMFFTLHWCRSILFLSIGGARSSACAASS